jgi:hypothetical protein
VRDLMLVLREVARLERNPFYQEVDVGVNVYWLTLFVERPVDGGSKAQQSRMAGNRIGAVS